MNRFINRPNHGQLTEAERSELEAILSKISQLHQQMIEQALSCLPLHMQARAKLDWYRRWEQG